MSKIFRRYGIGDSDEVCAAMKDLFENVRAVAEPSGALGPAGLKNTGNKTIWKEKYGSNFIWCQP